MAFTAHICGFTTNVPVIGYCNFEEISWDGATFTHTPTALTTCNLYAMTRDSDSNFYVATLSAVFKYTSALARVTTWGNGGEVAIATVGISVSGTPLAVNGSQQLLVGIGDATGEPKLYCFNSAGVSLWAVSTPTPFAPCWLPTGDVIAGNRGAWDGGTTTSVFYQLNGTTGAVTCTYPGISSTGTSFCADRATCVTSAGEIIFGGLGANAGYWQLQKFTPFITTQVWATTTGLCSTLLQGFSGPDGYMYTVGSTSSLRGSIRKINTATGVVTAQVVNTTAGGTCFMRGCVASDGTVIAISSGQNLWGYTVALATAQIFQTVGGGFDVKPWDISAGPKWSFAIQAPNDVVFTRRLLAFANDQIWIETTSGTVAEISEARNTVLTGSPLMATEAYQKAFIANTSILRVVDFANEKLWTASIGTNIPTKGTILSGATSSAQMNVDFLTNASSTCEIYGFRLTAATFTNGETVVNATMSVSFVLGAAAVTAPTTYAWTPFANDTTTYGTMPAETTLLCRYRGRLVLSGNRRAPHQWYMSRTANPWDWQYISNDALSPVAGQDADAGEIGDIITALITFGDDYLIFGCANSIHVLKGDPAFGGSIDELDHTTGIWGSRAWCRDGSNNVYFYGVGGLYKIGTGLSGIENLTLSIIPTLAQDWAAKSSDHRIVLAYDAEREGILVTRTTLSTGANVSYFYSLLTSSYYPEEFPPNCGVFCAMTYDAADPEYRKLLLGSADGFIRAYSDTYKYDEADTTIAAITSYAGWVTKLTADDDEDAVLNHITVETAGGTSTVAITSSDAVQLYFFPGDDADTVVENMAYNTLAFYSCAFSGTGLHPKERVRVRAKYLGIKAYGNVTGQTWAINRLSGDVEQMGDVE